MLGLRGIGPWTADYVAMRALGDPDAFLPTDIGVRNAGRDLGMGELPEVVERSRSWRPWRSYALLRLWSVVLDRTPAPPQTQVQTQVQPPTPTQPSETPGAP
jgi:AraC family transcriptional regulator of adaptative response / DNA-3-methyladenine glycosylase II